MYNKSEFTQIVLNLITILLVFDTVLQILGQDQINDNKKRFIEIFSKLIEENPNKFAGSNSTKFNHHLFHVRDHLTRIQRRIYRRLKESARRKLNEQRQKKYRTIVPVSILPGLIALNNANRWRQSEYYIVGKNESVEPKHIYLPGEPPKDPVAINALHYQHN